MTGSTERRRRQAGVKALAPGTLAVRIGDVRATGNFVAGELQLTGAQAVVLFDGPALQAKAAAQAP